MELEQYAFVLLRRGPKANEFSEDELEEPQAAHLAHLDEMSARGKLVVDDELVGCPRRAAPWWWPVRDKKALVCQGDPAEPRIWRQRRDEGPHLRP